MSLEINTYPRRIRRRSILGHIFQKKKVCLIVREIWYFCKTAQTGSGSYPDCYSMGSRILTLGVKWPGHEVDHSPLSSAEVKSEWSYNSSPPVCIQGMGSYNLTCTRCYLVQHIHHAHVWLCSLNELSYKSCIYIYIYWEGECWCCTLAHPGMAVRAKSLCRSTWCEWWKLMSSLLYLAFLQ